MDGSPGRFPQGGDLSWVWRVIQSQPSEERETSNILQDSIRNWGTAISEPREVSRTWAKKPFPYHERVWILSPRQWEPRKTLFQGGSWSDLHLGKVTFAAAWIGLRRGWRQRNQWVLLQFWAITKSEAAGTQGMFCILLCEKYAASCKKHISKDVLAWLQCVVSLCPAFLHYCSPQVLQVSWHQGTLGF